MSPNRSLINIALHAAAVTWTNVLRNNVLGCVCKHRLLWIRVAKNLALG